GVDLFKLDQVVLELLEGLVGADRRIPSLVSDAARNEIFFCGWIPEIAIANLEKAILGPGEGMIDREQEQGQDPKHRLVMENRWFHLASNNNKPDTWLDLFSFKRGKGEVLILKEVRVQPRIHY